MTENLSSPPGADKDPGVSSIPPGLPDGAPSLDCDTPPTAERHRQWKIPTLTAAAGLLLGLLVGGLWNGGGATAPSAQSSSSVGLMDLAAEACSIKGTAGITIGDGGKTLTFDGKGEEDASGASVDSLLCLFDMLDTPDAVRSHVSQTTSLDGRQKETWPTNDQSVTFSWTYHPNRGVDGVWSADPEPAD